MISGFICRFIISPRQRRHLHSCGDFASTKQCITFMKPKYANIIFCRRDSIVIMLRAGGARREEIRRGRILPGLFSRHDARRKPRRAGDSGRCPVPRRIDMARPTMTGAAASHDRQPPSAGIVGRRCRTGRATRQVTPRPVSAIARLGVDGISLSRLHASRSRRKYKRYLRSPDADVAMQSCLLAWAVKMACRSSAPKADASTRHACFGT